jgi:hypothetical protein
MELILIAAAFVASWVAYRRWSGERRDMAAWTLAKEARGRELFFLYEGSAFYMDREGDGDEFKALKVPRSVERAWMQELIAKYISALDRPGNYWSLSMLDHHWKYGYVRDALAARPLGLWWQKVAFLEQQFDYVRHARRFLRASGRDVANAARIVLAEGPRLRAEATNEREILRVDYLMLQAGDHAR